MGQQEVSEHLESRHGVQVGVELHQGLGLVVGQPDGGDALNREITMNTFRRETETELTLSLTKETGR